MNVQSGRADDRIDVSCLVFCSCRLIFMSASPLVDECLLLLLPPPPPLSPLFTLLFFLLLLPPSSSSFFFLLLSSSFSSSSSSSTFCMCVCVFLSVSPLFIPVFVVFVVADVVVVLFSLISPSPTDSRCILIALALRCLQRWMESASGSSTIRSTWN